MCHVREYAQAILKDGEYPSDIPHYNACPWALSVLRSEEFEKL